MTTWVSVVGYEIEKDE